MMVSQKALSRVALQPRDFYRDAHQKIYEAIRATNRADAILVANELSRRGQLEAVGGKPYLFTLVSSLTHAAHAGYYAAIVAECALLRRLIDEATYVAQEAYGRPESPIALAQEAKDRFSALAPNVSTRYQQKPSRPIEEVNWKEGGE